MSNIHGYKYNTMTKAFSTLREEHQQDLHEINLLRAGSALLFAKKVRENGKKVETLTRSAKGHFDSAAREENIEKKIDKMMDGMTDIADALFAERMMLGNLTGVAVSSAVLAERTDKSLNKLIKGRSRR